MPAAAEANRGSAAEAEGLAILVENLEIAFDADRPVVSDRDLGSCHPNSSVK
jgi:hypothetical protein